MKTPNAKFDRTVTHLNLNDNPIGEADIELELRMQVSKKIINELFEHIDGIKDKDINYGMHVLLGIIGATIIIALAIFINFFFDSFMPVEVIYGIAFVLFILYEIGVYVFFLQTVSKRATIDSKLLAKKYKDITEERLHYRNMRKTFNRMLKFKTSRTIKERNTSYLRAVNLLRLESLRFFTTEFDERTFKEINARVQEIILLSSENLARLHSDNLSKESYIECQQRAIGRNFYTHELFSTTILLYLLVRIQNQNSALSVRMHSKIAVDNLREIQKQIRENFGSDHKIWEDLAVSIEDE